LFSIVFLPYPTPLLSGRTDDPQTCALDTGPMTATSLAALVLKILLPEAQAEKEGGPEYSRRLSRCSRRASCAATVLAAMVPWVHL
jgi:hypothetical protein